jgi:hypothetical protein
MQYTQVTRQRKPDFLKVVDTPINSDNRNDIEILQVKQITSTGLIRFLEEKNISLPTARKYLTEIEYRVWNTKICDYRIYHSLGFKNDLLGYELSNKFYRGTTFRHFTTIAGRDHSQLNIFAGVFEFLSALELSKTTELKYDSLILNNLDLKIKTLHLVKSYKKINLFLNHSTEGIEAVNFYRTFHDRVRDFSIYLYPFPYLDLNDYLIKTCREKNSKIL